LTGDTFEIADSVRPRAAGCRWWPPADGPVLHVPAAERAA